MLIGLLFELLVIVPMRVPIDESPVFLLYQDWALGLIFLKIWTRLVSALIVYYIIMSFWFYLFIRLAWGFVSLAVACFLSRAFPLPFVISCIFSEKVFWVGLLIHG